MALIKLTSFLGEYPRQEPGLLPDNAAQSAINCDFSTPALQGIKDVSVVATMPNIGASEPIVSVWTENGAAYFGWPFEVDVVKNPVVDDRQRRICYTAYPSTGTILKQARTRRYDGTPVIGNDTILGNGTAGSGNYRPPEISGTLTGPDSWVLGIKPPEVQNVGPDDIPQIALGDRANYPDAPNLRLKVTFFIESPTGEILFRKDISNHEAAQIQGGTVYPQVFYTNNSDLRGDLIQDMLWPLGYTPRPLKYYWFDPPKTDTLSLSRTVTISNTEPLTGLPIKITYETSTPSYEAGNPSGPPTNNASGVIV